MAEKFTAIFFVLVFITAGYMSSRKIWSVMTYCDANDKPAAVGWIVIVIAFVTLFSYGVLRMAGLPYIIFF